MKMRILKSIICSLSFILFTSCSSSNSELFKETDTLVESLQTSYESYGILGGSDHAKTTSDGLYKITPIGRLINVKILKAVNDHEYEDLRVDLERHYRGDSRVNKVYVCQAGTIMVDCRN